MENSTPTKTDIEQAAARIAPFIHKTPVLTSSTLDKISGATLFFKCENFQKVGAFKFRGAANAVSLIKEDNKVKAVATHSSGNHAQALALAARMNGLKAYIVMPENAATVKKNAVLDYGAEVIPCKPTLQAREATLRQVVQETGATFVHPFNDYRIISGQATAAKEFIEEVSGLDWILVPVGGGGLLSGTALATHYFSRKTKVGAGEPEVVNDAFLSLREGKIVTLDNQTSVADGLLTSLGPKTFAIIEKYVEKILTVSEAEIVSAMNLVWERMKIIIEPSGAVPLAALLKNKTYFRGQNVGIIFSGGNVDITRLPF